MNEEQKIELVRLLRLAAIGWDDLRYAADKEEYGMLVKRFQDRAFELMDYVFPTEGELIKLEDIYAQS